MNRFMWSFLAAFAVLGGYVLSRFSSEVVPTGFLDRPLAAAVVLALVIGSVSLVFGRQSVLMAAGTALVIAWFNLWTLAVYAVAVVVSVFAERRGWETSKAAVSAAGVFAAASLITAIPQVDLTVGTPAHASPDGPPVYLILLDGYSGASVFAELGIDIDPFIEDMEERGFTHYPDAKSHSYHSHWVLSAMLTGEYGHSEETTTSERRAVRERLRLPDGFVTVASGVGHVTIPGARDVGPGGVTDFDMFLIEHSAFAYVPGVGEALMDRWRTRVDESLDTIADHDRMFAHVMAPHAPYLYGPDEPLGPPACWPESCGLLSARWIDDPGLEATVEWLNTRLVETIDEILARHADAQIIVFGDHGLRIRGGVAEDAFFQPLLLAHGVDFPDPHPEAIINQLSHSVEGGD